MKFATAKRELAKMAKGKFYSMKYDLSVHGDGDTEAVCWVYVDDGVMHTAPTWKEALAKLRRAMKPRPKPDRKEAPKEDRPKPKRRKK